MEKTELKEYERIDDLQIKGYRLIQSSRGFCFGMDAVLLSDYAHIRKGAVVMDLCSGTGVIPILLAARYETGRISGIEYQAYYADMAMRSVRMNGLDDRICISQGDVRQVKEAYPQGTFDYVTCNPPYMTGDHGLTNKDPEKAIARHEICCSLTDVVSAAKWLLKPAGHFIMVHRPFRLAEILSCLKEYKLEPKRMRLVYPYLDKEPNMVLIDAVKGGRQRITVEPPLIVYRKNGAYTEEIHKIYGSGGSGKSPGPVIADAAVQE